MQYNSSSIDTSNDNYLLFLFIKLYAYNIFFQNGKSINFAIILKNMQSQNQEQQSSFKNFKVFNVQLEQKLIQQYLFYVLRNVFFLILIHQQFKFEGKKLINSFFMNSRQISLMFDHNKKEYNPAQTFGVRQSLNPTISSLNKDTKVKKYLKPSRQLEQHDQQNYRGQTRIRLLTSFQESYLESISQPIFTEPDQGSDIKPPNRSNTLSYSQSKRPNHNADKYLNTDPNQTFQNLNHQAQKQTFDKHKDQRRSNQINKYQNKQNSRNQASNREEKKNQAAKDKINNLSRSIEQQLYNLSIQQRLYEYLMSRIDDRGRLRKKKDNHQIIQNAIDFMDSGEQFMRDLLKLKKMYNQS